MHTSSIKRISTPKSSSATSRDLPPADNLRKGVTAFAFICISLLLAWGWSRQVIFAALEEAQTHPRFGLAGADIETLRSRTEELKKSVGAVAEYYPDPAEQNMIQASLNPIGFLETLPGLEKARREFITSPTIKQYLAYRKDLQRTAKYYQKDLVRYRDTLEKLPRSSKNEFYHYGTNAVTLNTIISNISSLIKNAETLIVRRPEPNHPALSVQLSKPGQIPQIPARQQIDVEFTQKIITAMGWKPLMPLAEIPTDCVTDPRGEERDLFYLVRIKNFLAPLSVKQTFFHYTLSFGEDVRYFKPLREAGFDYAWQPNYNYYFCPDVSYHAQTLTLYRVRELLLEWRTSRWSIKLPELTSTVDSFLKADPIWREIQDEMFGAIQSVLEKYSDQKLRELAGDNTPEMLREILEIKRENSGYFEELIRRGTAMNLNLARLIPLLKKPFSAKELFATRSFPSLYFLPFNGSVWPQDKPLSFVKYYGETKYYTDYQTLLKTYPEDKILSIVTRSIGLVNQ